jgi:hypothetical protein
VKFTHTHTHTQNEHLKGPAFQMVTFFCVESLALAIPNSVLHEGGLCLESRYMCTVQHFLRLRCHDEWDLITLFV